VALSALNLSRNVLVCKLVNNNVKLFDVNRITQQPDFYSFFIFLTEPA